ncbi:MAG: type I restriction enzyme HsdR N-terminal domain-containing protein [Paludisphaera borealis]|uniref:type I restriction enzyme HsdR N-terminal domain-containing protein n=1 Tax=Paludisphaera borealis TaxID=1387353 RepID=UPI00283D7DBF|nr:type I restriction enzyme HsdR N-terminal domain-containing protein [Paludisphaera borealis]MDR3618079.1 type I restriction enzyme HsdR N-terminal domain-containing protein [Paludisphaera borealis]
MREALQQYVKRVQELAEHVRGNEQATKQSLVGPLLTLLGYDLTDPRECVPEYRVDFGANRSVKPIDWAFFQATRPIFFVEAKEVGKRLGSYDEQLADYFAKAPEARLGILTNGVQWRFFTDVVNPNIMDKEPFVKWDVLTDEQPPFDFLTLIQKAQYNKQLIRTFAERKRAQNLLVSELNRLLEPASEFVKLAIANIETRRISDKVVDDWKPVLSNAINEWARQRTLTAVLENPARSDNQAAAEGSESNRIETTQEELAAYEIVRRHLGPSRPVAYEDTVSYFKIHLAERYTWVMCRLYLGRKRPTVWVPLPLDQVQPMTPDFVTNSPQAGWTCITLAATSEIERLGDVLRAAWDSQRAIRSKGDENDETEAAEGQNQPEPGTGASESQGLEIK